MWVARDECECLHLYFEKPIKMENEKFWLYTDEVYNSNPCITAPRLKNKLFPEVTWEDEEPKYIRFYRQEWIVS